MPLQRQATFWKVPLTGAVLVQRPVRLRHYLALQQLLPPSLFKAYPRANTGGRDPARCSWLETGSSLITALSPSGILIPASRIILHSATRTSAVLVRSPGFNGCSKQLYFRIHAWIYSKINFGCQAVVVGRASICLSMALHLFDLVQSIHDSPDRSLK
ncbi:hypothetical protein BDZ91DRAFT_485984 [Kalaharituber pfeilii]|nr:hypothetical protein BDZ91DRAFT_485984 [Kalaharituber pfeilii]